MKTKFNLEFTCFPGCEGFARVTAAAFVARANPTVEELEELKTAISEAVTNCMVHGYEHGEGEVRMEVCLRNRAVTVVIEDDGCGIRDIDRAMEACYTSKPQMEHAGMGFTFMQLFMDEVTVQSSPGKGTRITMSRNFADMENPVSLH